MHMRKKEWARKLLFSSPYYIDKPAEVRGRWAQQFPEEAQPLHVELGCGKGVATAKMAHANPLVNYLAIDIGPDVLGSTCKNLNAEYGADPIDNIRLTKLDIGYIDQYVAPEDRVERIYINFPNPWTMRAKQHKRRLTHPRQLMHYRTFLVDGGEIRFKTDDVQLWQASLVYFKACGFEADYLTDDLHADGFQPNYVSEHEMMYSEKGIPIHFGIFRKLPGNVEIDPVRWRIWDGEDGENAQEEAL